VKTEVFLFVAAFKLLLQTSVFSGVTIFLRNICGYLCSSATCRKKNIVIQFSGKFDGGKPRRKRALILNIVIWNAVTPTGS